jgi:hypothetical protein
MNRHRSFSRSILAAAIVSCLGLGAAQAQAPAAEGAAKPTPRTPDGRPDLNGTWDNGSGIDFVRPQKSADGSICVSGCPAPANAAPAGPRPAAAPRPGPDRPKYKPEFVAKVQDLEKRQIEMDPVLRCHSPGLPRIGPPDKIVQTSKEMAFIYDDVSGAFWRIIPLTAKQHRKDADESYLGDAIGRWEGDTLVIETVNFNEDTWLTDDGAFHTKDLKVTERLTRNGDMMEWQAIAEDPKVLAEPWKLRPRGMRLANVELQEPAPCIDQDLKHVVDGTHHDNPR